MAGAAESFQPRGGVAAGSVCAHPVRVSRSRPAGACAGTIKPGQLPGDFRPRIFPAACVRCHGPQLFPPGPPWVNGGGPHAFAPVRVCVVSGPFRSLFSAHIIPAAPLAHQVHLGIFCAVCSKVILCFKPKICRGQYLVIVFNGQALEVLSCTCSN